MITGYDSLIEMRRQVLQTELDAGKSGRERNRLGQFATPNTLAIEIAQYVEFISRGARDSMRFADPSIGTGSFYSAALNVFGPERIERAVGIELDPVLCEAARDLWRDSGLEVLQGDFTRLVEKGSQLEPISKLKKRHSEESRSGQAPGLTAILPRNLRLVHVSSLRRKSETSSTTDFEIGSSLAQPDPCQSTLCATPSLSARG